MAAWNGARGYEAPLFVADYELLDDEADADGPDTDMA